MDKIKKYLHDILNAILEIELFLKERPKTFEYFCQDIIFKRASERNIEIMGEAMNRILKIDPEINITSSRNIVRTRNYVIHSYDSIREEILWGIIINDLPKLKKEVMLLLNYSEDFIP